MMQTRRDHLLSGIDKATAVGLEIGAWTRPIAPKSEGWRTTTVDFASTEELREIAQFHSSLAMRELSKSIENVDIVWRGGSLREVVGDIYPEGLDYVIASHVLEHIPDLITILQDLSYLLRDNGVISLALPNKQSCFDIFRPVTLTHDLLLANREKRTRHSPETLFASYAYQASDRGWGSWSTGVVPDLSAVKQLHQAFSAYNKEVAAGTKSRAYIDAHAWVFVPDSFELVILELNMLGLIDLRLRAPIVQEIEAEFIVQLERGPLEYSEEELENQREKILLSLIDRRNAICIADDHPEIRKLRSEVAELRSYGINLDKVLADLQAELAKSKLLTDYLRRTIYNERVGNASLQERINHYQNINLLSKSSCDSDDKDLLIQNLENHDHYQQQIIHQLNEAIERLYQDKQHLEATIVQRSAEFDDLYALAVARHDVIGNLQAELREKRVEINELQSRHVA